MYWESTGYTTNNIRYWCVWKLDRPPPQLRWYVPMCVMGSQQKMGSVSVWDGWPFSTHPHTIFLSMARMLKLCFDFGFGFHKMMAGKALSAWTMGFDMGLWKVLIPVVVLINIKTKDWFHHQEFPPVTWGQRREGVEGLNTRARILLVKRLSRGDALKSDLGWFGIIIWILQIEMKGALTSHWYYGKPLTFLLLKRGMVCQWPHQIRSCLYP